VLVDITAHSFGIRTVDLGEGQLEMHRYARVLGKGSPLPTTRSEVFSTMVDGQQSAEIEIFQGEEASVLNNRCIGNFVVEGLSDVPAPNPIVVELQLTLNGTLTVTATEKKTGLRKNVVIDRPAMATTAMPASANSEAVSRPDGPTTTIAPPDDATLTTAEAHAPSEDVDRSLAGSVAEPRPSSSPDLDVTELRKTVERVRALFDSMTAADRDEAEVLVSRLTSSLDAGRPQNARGAHEELREILYYVEEI
jgi:molecular chaperone DnaK